jgi:uncharacterized protein involved in outer membrane biogenesis
VTRRPIHLRILILVIAFVVLFGLARFAVRKISTGPLRDLIEKNLTEALDLAVSLDELEVALLPSPHLHAEGVWIASPPARATPHLLMVERVDLGIKFWPLFRRKVVIDTIAIEGADLHVETDVEGRLGGHLKLGALVLGGDEDFVQLELRHVHAETLRVFYRDAREGASYSLILDSVAMKSKELGSGISLDMRGQFEGSPIALSGRVGSLSELMERTEPFPIDLHGQLFEANFDAKGTVGEPWKLRGFEVEISGNIPKLIVQDHPLPQIGIVHFGGQLSDSDGSLGFEQLSLDSAETSPVRIALRGKMDDLIGLREVDVELDIETLSLEFLRPLLQSELDFSLPTIGSLSANVKLTDQNGRLDLDGVVHAVTSGDAIVMHVDGGIHDLVGAAKIDVKIESRAEDLASITSLVPDIPAHGTFGPLIASARLMSQEGALAANAIEVRIGDRDRAWVELDGSIADVAALLDVELQLIFGAQSLHHLEELLGRELPRTSPLIGSAAISDKDGTLGFEHLRLNSDASGPIEIHLEARFDDFDHRDELEILLGLTGEDTRALGAIVGIELPVISPVEFHGEVKGSDEHIEVKSMTLRLGETRLRGSLSGAFAPDVRPSVKARLESANVRLQDLALIPSEKASSLFGSNGSQKREGGAALSFERLRDVDLDLGLQFDRVGGYRGLDGNDVGFMVRLHDGDLLVSDVRANYQGGELNAQLHVDARRELPRLEVELRTKALNISQIMLQFEEQTDYSGIIDADVELKARGRTLDSLRQSLSGNITASMRDGNAASRIAREFVVSLTEAVFPDLGVKSLPNVGCAALDLEIRDGIASVRTLFLQGKEAAVMGTGKVDLVRGLYDLHVIPTTTNPGILSVAPEVYIDGPLDDPVFHPQKRTLVTSFGRGLLQNATRVGGVLLRPFGIGSRRYDEFLNNCSPRASKARDWRDATR